MKTIFALVGVSIACLCAHGAGLDTKADPKSIVAAEIPKLIRSFPKDVGFGFSGAAYYYGTLYVSSNLGLLVLKNRQPTELDQWVHGDSVVEGPWLDVSGDTLWAQQANDGSLVRLEGSRWTRLPLPEPPKGYNRGDILSGFRGISGAGKFWIVGGGVAWRWEQAPSRWFMEPLPAMPEGSGLRTFFRLGDASVCYARDGYEIGFGGGNNTATVYAFSGSWNKFTAVNADIRESVVTGQLGYLRSEDGALFQITAEKMVRLETPAPCDAITQTSTGALLASFGRAGIYLRIGDRWELRAESPAGANDGKRWAHLAENAGEIAFVTAPIPDLEGPSYRTVYSAKAGIWIFSGGKFEKVDFGK